MLLYLILPLTSFCQIKYKVNEIDQRGISGYQAMYRTAILLIKGTNGKDTIFWNGCGFILKGEYVATCYHVFKGPPTYSPIEIKVKYSINNRDKPNTYDSTYATINYKVNRYMYDFKKHSYDTSNPSTDFIILKLSKKVKYVPPVFDTGVLKMKERLVSVGRTSEGVMPEYGSEQLVLAKLVDFTNGYESIVSRGFARPGFSGSPMFNKIGNIVGMVWGGQSEENATSYLNELLNSNLISRQLYDETVKAIEDNHSSIHVAYATGIGYLLKKYMKGYY